MGAGQSNRKITVMNDDVQGVIKISDAVVERLKGEMIAREEEARRQKTLPPPPPAPKPEPTLPPPPVAEEIAAPAAPAPQPEPVPPPPIAEDIPAPPVVTEVPEAKVELLIPEVSIPIPVPEVSTPIPEAQIPEVSPPLLNENPVHEPASLPEISASEPIFEIPKVEPAPAPSISTAPAQTTVPAPAPASAPAPAPAPAPPPIFSRPIIQYVEEPSISALRVRQEKEAEMSALQESWSNRLAKVEAAHRQEHSLSQQEIEASVAKVGTLFAPAPVREVCRSGRQAVQECYTANPSKPLLCRDMVLEFSKCVRDVRAELIQQTMS